MSKRILSLALALLLTLSLAACGGGNDNGGDKSSAPSMQTDAPNATSPSAQTNSPATTTPSQPETAHGDSAGGELVGKWEMVVDGVVAMSYDFAVDYTVKVTHPLLGNGEGTYKVQGDMITITTGGDDEKIKYSIKGDTLTVDNGQGGTWEMTRAGAAPDTPPDGEAGDLTMDKIKQTAKDKGYMTVDSIGFNSGSGVSEPVDGISINKADGSATYIGVLEFVDAAQAQKYADYLNGFKTQYPSTYAKYGYFSFEKFFFQIEDLSNSAGKDLLTALVPNWETLIK